MRSRPGRPGASARLRWRIRPPGRGAYAEALGFDSAWIGEHHFDRYICPITMLTASGPLNLRDYYRSQETYESVLYQVGFKRVVWHAMQVSSEGFEAYGSTYWQAYLTHPHIVVLEAQKCKAEGLWVASQQ